MGLKDVFRGASNQMEVTLDLVVRVANIGSLGGPGLAARGLTITDGSANCTLWIRAPFGVSAGDSLRLQGTFLVGKVLGMRQLYQLSEKGAIVWNTTKGTRDPPVPQATPVPPTPPPPAPARVEPTQVIVKETIREIVKVPCRYCGFLNVNTESRCGSCGAPTK